MTVRILLADDSPPWHTFVSSVLRSNRDWELVCEVADGAEAIQKAQELKPDLILLDIGLPKINGIDAARQIRQLVPASKILFMSVCDSMDVVEAALKTGADGYVVKADAGSELAKALEAVMQGKRFVSSRARRGSRSNGDHRDKEDCHVVQFYSDDEEFIGHAIRFVGNALKGGGAAIVVATKAHRDCLVHGLNAQGIDVDALLRQGAYVSLDARDALSTFMVNDWPDEARFVEGFGKLIESASKAASAEHPRIAVCGEGVALLCGDGKTEAAIRLEQLCNVLAGKFNVDIFCAYPFSVHVQDDDCALRAVCAQHSVVYGL